MWADFIEMNRRTGSTTLLVNAAKEALAAGKKVWVVVPTMDVGVEIRRMGIPMNCIITMGQLKRGSRILGVPPRPILIDPSCMVCV